MESVSIGNFCALGKPADGVHEADIFVFFDERKNVAAFMAAEAMKNLAVRVDVEAGRLFLVKRTEGGEIGSGAFELEIGADDVDDVTGVADAFESCLGETGHALGACAPLFSYMDYRF